MVMRKSWGGGQCIVHVWKVVCCTVLSFSGVHFHVCVESVEVEQRMRRVELTPSPASLSVVSAVFFLGGMAMFGGYLDVD